MIDQESMGAPRRAAPDSAYAVAEDVAGSGGNVGLLFRVDGTLTLESLQSKHGRRSRPWSSWIFEPTIPASVAKLTKRWPVALISGATLDAILPEISPPEFPERFDLYTAYGQVRWRDGHTTYS